MSQKHSTITEQSLISVIIPVYNHQQYIRQTLDSILADSYPNKEICIINDGSSDESDRIIKEWVALHDHEIKIKYKYRENRGISATLNELVHQASGEYILPIASDDYLINGLTRQRVELLKSQPSKLMLINDAIVVDEDNNLLYQSGNFELYSGKKEEFMTDNGLANQIVNNWSCVGPICLINKKLYSIIGPYNDNLEIEDWDFYLRAASRNLLIFADMKVAAYRLHTKNTHSLPAKKIHMLNTIAKTALLNFRHFRYPLNIKLFLKYLKAKSKSSILKIVLFSYFNTIRAQ